jgi:hypothetical protein
MLLRGAAVLAGAALHAHAFAVTPERVAGAQAAAVGHGRHGAPALVDRQQLVADAPVLDGSAPSGLYTFDMPSLGDTDPFDDLYTFDTPSLRPADPASSDQSGRLSRPETTVEGSPSQAPGPHPNQRPQWKAPHRNGEFPFSGPHLAPRWENRMLIVPDKKLAFCYIEKNACTQFNRLVNALNGMSSDDRIPFWKSNSDGHFNTYFKAGLDSISKANGWKLGIFVRDPAERFLSAWLSKCDAWEYGGMDCLGSRVTDLPESKKVEAFEKTVVELLPKYMAIWRANGTYNAHYDPQHAFCGGRHLDEYDFVGTLSGSPKFISKQVEDMLQHKMGIGESNFLMRVSRKLFPKEGRVGHASGTMNVLKKFYRNHTIYKTVLAQYAQDYRWAPYLKPGNRRERPAWAAWAAS